MTTSKKFLPSARVSTCSKGYRDLGNEMAATGASLRRGQIVFIARNISQYECLAPNGSGTSIQRLKQRMIAERFGCLDEGLVSRDRRAIREKIETEPNIRKWFPDLTRLGT